MKYIKSGVSMYDTVVLKSQFISEEIAKSAEYFCTRMEGVDLFTGEILYTFTRAELAGSYDYRIRMNVERTIMIRENTPSPVRIPSQPYIKIECSLHKLLLGHNCYGGPDNFKLSVKYLIKFLEDIMNLKLPFFLSWYVERLDIAYVFNLGDKKVVFQYLRNMKNMYYVRRGSPVPYKGGLYYAGSSTTDKLYHKGYEYQKHDYKRLKKNLTKRLDKENRGSEHPVIEEMLKKYYNIGILANKLLRCEVEIKKRKLIREFSQDNENVYVNDIDDDYCKMLYDEEFKRIISEGQTDMKTVRDSNNVRNRLIDEYGKRTAKTLMGTWHDLALHGEEYCRLMMAESTLRRHKKLLKDKACEWSNTDVFIKKYNIVPLDFKPYSDSFYNFNEIDPEVRKKLESVA